MNTPTALTHQPSAMQLDTEHIGHQITIRADGPHTITGTLREIIANPTAGHLSTLTVTLDLDLGPGLTNRIEIRLNPDFPVDVTA